MSMSDVELCCALVREEEILDQQYTEERATVVSDLRATARQRRLIPPKDRNAYNAWRDAKRLLEEQ